MTEQERYDAEMARFEALAEQRQASIESNLPSWAQVETACDNISSLAEAKAFIKKLSRVVYWIARNSET